MLTQLNISEEDKSQATANDNNQTKGGANPGNPFVDNRTEALEQKKNAGDDEAESERNANGIK
jgi:hypothetical protein